MKSYIFWGSYIWWMLQPDDKDFEIELIGLKLSSLMYFSDLFCGFFSFLISWSFFSWAFYHYKNGVSICLTLPLDHEHTNNFYNGGWLKF